ncbi:MAG: uroporphyrinogen decarboxylase family protein [Chloroflexota bacterium]|nr:uroporphyrinogen decarboxylase family protein [Chloroflexota bacterium]
MNSRERVQTALNHQEPDRVPFDLGGTPMSGMHRIAYKNLRAYLGLPEVEIRVVDSIQQLAAIDDDVADLLKIDIHNVAPRSSAKYNLVYRDEGDYTAYTDEWGIGWRSPKKGGLYYDMYSWPLAPFETAEEIAANYTWPDAGDPNRFAGLRERALETIEQGKAVVVGSLSAGVSEMHAWTRGFEKYFTDFYLYPDLAEYIMDQVVELKMIYWENVFNEIGDLADVVIEADDLAGQKNLFFSLDMYRQYIKPRHTRLFSFMKARTNAKLFYHCDGALLPLLWDLKESGIDVLNPLQKSAAGIDYDAIKKEYGNDISFWGAGVDTQRVFDRSTPEEVREDTRRNIEIMAPGGGFVCTPIHNTQATVSPENYMAFWETLQEEGVY